MFLQCPHCGEYASHYPDGFVEIGEGRRARQLKCANSICGKTFRADQAAQPSPPRSNVPIKM